MQFFKGDATELKYYESGKGILDILQLQIDLFAAGAYETYVLGDMIHDSGRSPLCNAIRKEIFRQAFKEIFEAFVVAGSFESYLTVFRKIFGDEVTVEFTVPGPGQLEIDIEADGVELSDLVVRQIVNNAYQFFNLVDQESNEINIAVQTIKGFQSQYELEQMLFEMVPGGIYTVINLTIGEEE